MTIENHKLATAILAQIDKLNKLKHGIKREYKKTEDSNLKEVLSECDNAISVLIEIDQDKFDKL